MGPGRGSFPQREPSRCHRAIPSLPWEPRQTPSVHDKYLFKVFPVVSVINGPLTQSMNQVSGVNLQEALLRAHPTLPATQSVGGGSGGR